MFPVPFLRIRKIHSSCNCTVTTASPTQHSEDWMEIYIRSSPDHQRQWNWNLSVKELSMVKNLFHLHPKSTTQTTRCQSVFVTALCMNKRENVFYRQTFFNMKVEIAQWAGRHSISAMVDYVGSHGVCRLGLSHVEPDWVSIRCQKEDWCVVPTAGIRFEKQACSMDGHPNCLNFEGTISVDEIAGIRHCADWK